MVKIRMSVAEAIQLIGNREEWELKEMRKKLSKNKFFNSDMDNRKLEAINVLITDIRKDRKKAKKMGIPYEGYEARVNEIEGIEGSWSKKKSKGMFDIRRIFK